VFFAGPVREFVEPGRGVAQPAEFGFVRVWQGQVRVQVRTGSGRHLPEPGRKRLADCGDALPLTSRLPGVRVIPAARFSGASSVMSCAGGSELDACGDRVARDGRLAACAGQGAGSESEAQPVVDRRADRRPRHVEALVRSGTQGSGHLRQRLSGHVVETRERMVQEAAEPAGTVVQVAGEAHDRHATGRRRHT
jgi:hypothetical protein